MSAFDIAIYPVRFICETVTPIHLGVQSGAQFRGALWEVLQSFACTDPKAQKNPGHAWHCPMCFVLSLETPGARGINPARPLVVRPPLPVRAGDDCVFMAGDIFRVELVLIGEAVRVFPYLFQAMRQIGQKGVGYGRGRYQVNRVQLVNPLSGTCVDLWHGARVRMPEQPVTMTEVTRHANTLNPEQLWLRFLTMTQLTHEHRTLIRPQMDALIMRILERLQSLEDHYGQPVSHEVWKERHETLAQVAIQSRIRRDETRWLRAKSGSRRANRMQDISGFVGSAWVEGDLRPLREWLVWASLINVGKNAIKGNGWFEVKN